MAEESDRAAGGNPEDQSGGITNDAVAAHLVESPPLEEADPGTAVSEQDRESNLSMILDIPVNIRVELGQARLSIQEILKLGAGSVVELNRLAGQPADIIANGKLIGQGDIVVVDDNLGIRITSLVGPEQRVKSL